MSRKKTNKIEAETGEVVQSNRPFIIRNGGIAKPLGQGLYLLGGKTHEQGGIDIDFTGDARIFSAQPILNGNSPAELVARGANPNITFNRQERFKSVNRINDDGSRKAKCGKRVKAEIGTETKQEVPTREEYITNKIDSTINNSLKRSLNKTVPDLVYVPITESNYSSANAEIEFEKNNINKFSIKAAKAVNDGDYESYYKYMNDAKVSSARLNRLTSLRNKGLCEGPNCIYNATKNYGDEYATTGNYTFMENHDKKGFIKIDSSSKRPGDIVQVINNWNNAPSHAMTYYRTDENGVDRFNYSNGNSNKQAIRKDGKYPVDKGIRLDYYRFVGTPADSVRWTNEYNKLYMNNSNKKQLGGSTGLIRVQANGKDRLMYVPFTGEETKANRKKAAFGIELNTPKLSYDFTKVDKIMESIKEGNKNKNWWKNNGNYVIGALGNIGAGIASYAINKRMLGDLDYSPAPVAKRAAKLKTDININPELTALNENLSKTIELTNANTASSRVANARNQAAMLNTTLTANKLYADKENRETALINQDRLNQQEVANANIDAYNTWRTDKTTFENTIREQQSENAVSLVDNINKGIQTGITDAERRRQFRNNLATMAAAYPNVTPELLRTYGVDFLRMGGKVKLNKKK